MLFRSLLGAAVIVFLSLLYTQQLVNKLREDEKTRISLWAQAIQKKAALVKFTTDIILQTAEQEKEKAELFARCMRELQKDVCDYSFVVDVLSNNKTVPVVLVDDNGIMTPRNLPDSTRERDTAYIRSQIEEMKKIHPPIVFEYVPGKKQYVYFKNSLLYEFTREVFERNIKSFINEVADNTAAVPVILMSVIKNPQDKPTVIAYGKVSPKIIEDEVQLNSQLLIMANHNEPIDVNVGEGPCRIYYENSFLLQQLRYYPWIQFVAIGLFLVIAYVLFSTSRKAEQNQVWVGMSKETAHQLGTPLTALYGWVEYFRSAGGNENAVIEMNRDLDRLKVVSERFSKIGSQPKLSQENIVDCVASILDYMKSRTSRNITISFANKIGSAVVNLSRPLFEWVIENLVRNAIDAMDGKGEIRIEIHENEQEIYIDV